MRILGIGEYGGLGEMYLRLLQAGHDVRMYVGDPKEQGIFAGLVPRCADWRAELPWVRAAGDEGIVVFECADMGATQDRLRAEGYAVIGGSAWGDRLENDRAWAQQQMRAAGLRTAATLEFTDFSQALRFLNERPGRYVYKRCSATAASTCNYVGQLSDGADVRAVLQREQAQWREAQPPRFVLMEFVEGVEVGIGAYFNGEHFLEPACIDFEHKHFFPGDLGELTGEMGTVVSYRHSRRLFERSLGLFESQLRAGGYCGYINLNMIANAEGLWPLEFTSRFGYPGYAICDALHEEGWDAIFRKMLGKEGGPVRTRDGFSVGVVLTVPPFPYREGDDNRSAGSPIFFRGALSAAERARLYYSDVALDEGGNLVASGSAGYLMVATGCGAGIVEAQRSAYALAGRVVAPNLRYRNDIGDRVLRADWARLAEWGLLG